MQLITALAPESQTALLALGLLASLVKVASDLFAGIRWNGYSFKSQSISELGAIGSPTRSIVVPFELAYDLLMTAFGIGLWQVAEGSPFLRVAAALVIANALISLVVILFFPMRLGSTDKPPISSTHLVLMATSVLCFLLAILLGGVAQGGWFLFFSLSIPFLYMVLAVARTIILGPRKQLDPRSTIGAQERTMAAGYLLWVAVLSLMYATHRAGA
jgi:hypothetical protein